MQAAAGLVGMAVLEDMMIALEVVDQVGLAVIYFQMALPLQETHQ